MFAKLLLPTDFGPCSDEAVVLAKKIAAPDAQVRLTHVIANETTLFFADMLDLDRFVERAQKGLDDRKALHDSRGFQIETQIREGAIQKEVLKEIEDYAPDVVVMGSHGRKGLERLLLGSIAERILRKTTLPVAVVKDEVPRTDKLAKIGLATDLEDTMTEATNQFAALLAGSGAKGLLVHAFHAEHWLSMTMVPAPYGDGAYHHVAATPAAEVETRLQREKSVKKSGLETAAAGLRDRGLDVTGKLLDGEPWTEIARLAEDEELDLLILGTHKYKGLDRLMLGSVAEKTLRTVHCPVLIVPHSSP